MLTVSWRDRGYLDARQVDMMLFFMSLQVGSKIEHGKGKT